LLFENLSSLTESVFIPQGKKKVGPSPAPEALCQIRATAQAFSFFLTFPATRYPLLLKDRLLK
jgi:hypothetical protein